MQEELNEDEKQNKMNEENQNTDGISNSYGEEEDEDDLLKSDTESNVSFKSIRQMEANAVTNENNDKNDKNNNNDNNENKSSDENNIKNDDNSLKKYVESLELERRRRRASGPPKILNKKMDDFEEEEDEDEDEDEDEEEGEDHQSELDDDSDEDNESESINPYQKYANSQTKYYTFLPCLIKRDVVYDKTSNKYYIYMGSLSKKRCLYVSHDILKKKRKDEIFNVIEEKFLGEYLDDEFLCTEIYNSINQPDFLVPLDKDEKESYNEILVTSEEESNKFSVFKRIKIHYLNYLNNKLTFTVLININTRLNDFVNILAKMYHFPNQKSLNKYNLTLFIKGDQYTGKSLNNSKDRLFVPSKFDYDKDYVFVLEYQNFDIINIDLGSKNSKYNFQGEKVPHIVFSSYNNFCLESILVSNKLSYLECDIYVFKDELCLNVDRNIGKYNFRKAKDILSSINWKDKCKFLTTIKSINSSSYKNNDDAISFSITSNLILRHNKTYIFLINTPKRNINVFNSGCGDQGLFIISSDDKAILNGFTCKKLSDLCINK